MQKTITVVLALLMLLSLNPSVKAEVGVVERTQVVPSYNLPANVVKPVAITQEKALEVLWAAFPEILSGKELEAEYAEDGRANQPCWNFSLKGEADGRRYNGPELSAAVNALTGEILSMNYNPQADYYRGKPVVLTREQAYPIAQKFLQKIQPDKAATLIFQENKQEYYNPQGRLAMYYSYYWHRQVNGIKVDWDNVYIGVDAASGKVTHYSYSWHDGQFPKVGKTMSKTELTAKLVDEIGLYPSYVLKPFNMDSGILIPVYQLNTDSQLFDCQTGQALKRDGTKIAEQDKRIYEQPFNPQAVSKQENPPQLSQKINPELAKKTAEGLMKKLGITGELRRSGGGSSSGAGYNEEYWNYSLVGEENNHRSGNGPELSINVLTGEISRFDNYTAQNRPGEAGISYKEALNRAQDVIQKLNPEKKNQLVLRKGLGDKETRDVYNLDFARLINGISCEGGIRVEINKQNGSLSSYWVNWHPVKLAAVSKLISLEKAQKIYKSNQPFELAYIFPEAISGQVGAPLLVYRNAQPNQIDALSGEMLSWGRGKQPTVSNAAFRNHWAAPALSLLQESWLAPERIIPDGTINRRQAIRILVAATRSNYYSYDNDISLAFTDIKADDTDLAIIQQAVKKGIISNYGKFNPEQSISREEMAVWLVNCLGYQDIARMKNGITVSFRDLNQITSDKQNYVGLADGLGLLNADAEQNFRPKAAITWAEMAVAATNMAARTNIQARY